MKKIRWGVLSTAKIGTKKVIPAMQLLMVPMKNCWPTLTSMLFTFRFPIICMYPGPSKH